MSQVQTLEEVPKQSTPDIDKNIFGEPSLDYVEGKALGFLADFIENVEYDTEAAFVFSSLMEHSLEARYKTSTFISIMDQFPKGKIKHIKQRDKAIKNNQKYIKKIEKQMLEDNLAFNAMTSDLTDAEQREKYKDCMELVGHIKADIIRLQSDEDYNAVYNHDTEVDVEARKNDWKYLGDLFRKESKALLKNGEPSVYDKLSKFNDYFAIKGTEKGLTEIVFYNTQLPWFYTFNALLGGGSLKGMASIWSRMLDTDFENVIGLMSNDAISVKKNIVSYLRVATEDNQMVESIGFNSLISDAIIDFKNKNFEDVVNAITGKPLKADFDLESFSYLGKAKNLVSKVMKTALKTGEVGANALLLGGPGLGKTEFAKTLAQSLGVKIFSVGGERDSNLSSKERMHKLVVMQNLLEGTGSLILVDELSDFLPGNSAVRGGAEATAMGASGSDGSKECLHQIFENNPTPTIYTENDAQKFHVSIMQRISASIEFSMPPVLEQEKMWKYINKANKKINQPFNLSSKQCKELSETVSVPPRIMFNALEKADNFDDVKLSIEEAAKRIYQVSTAFDLNYKLPAKYNLDLIEAEVEGRDLSAAKLLKSLAEKAKDVALSICIYGPAGSGKTAYAVDMANSMGKTPIILSSSMLSNPYKGGGADPYTAAKGKLEGIMHKLPEGVMLIIEDDTDDDGNPKISEQVVKDLNNMLENKIGNTFNEIDIPMMFLTNKAPKKGIPARDTKNFNYVVKFGYAGNKTAKKSFKNMFGKVAPKSLQSLQKLTIGDFSNVQRKLEAEILPVKPIGIVKMLEKEVAMRSDVAKGVAGYFPAS